MRKPHYGSSVSHYSFQATEDNEMTLVEGEYIEQIEEIDEGWWSGVGPGGKIGLFPCMFCHKFVVWSATSDVPPSQLR
jgi:hypothetical protein